MQAIKLEIPARYENKDVFTTKANVYMLDVPFIKEVFAGDDDSEFPSQMIVKFVIASDNTGLEFIRTSETLLFPCDIFGVIQSWGEIGGGYTHTHESAFAEIGYEIVT